MKKSISRITIYVIISAVLASFLLTSCSRYASESYGSGCGVWYPKKCKIGTKNW